MRTLKYLLLFCCATLLFSSLCAQKLQPQKIAGDPYGVSIYKLQNGLTVMLSINKNAPQIQTMIAIKAGSKNDPADNTGLAHYLEHLLFKGSEDFGTKSYSGEKFYLNKIDGLYKLYAQSDDSVQRANVYGFIDSFSLLASKIAIANEYDRMMQAIGATGTNAFTSFDNTVYINNIPGNQLEKWLKIEQNRFERPVFRLFHTELEAVYEEKNISLDNDMNKAYEALLKHVFPFHTYGTQTTIGTVEHLKNPNLDKIREFYKKYYKANNMALIMSGDFDEESTIALVDRYLGNWQSSSEKIEATWKRWPDSIDFMDRIPEEITDITQTVTGPKEEMVLMGFRTGGANTKDALLLYMTDMILANSQAGMLDINLNKAQKVQYAVCSPLQMKEYGLHYFMAYPKDGQKLEECRAFLLEELEKLKRGEFDEAIMSAIVENMKLNRAISFNDNYARTNSMMEAFVNESEWQEYIDMPAKLEKLTKKDVIEFANSIYTPKRRTTIFKVMGKDENIQKVPKPKITPIETNREAQSQFARKLEEMGTESIQAKFPDFGKEITTVTTGEKKRAVTLSHVANTETDFFTLYIRFDMGTNNDPWLQHIADYMPYLATKTQTNEQLSRQFFNLACEFGFSTGTENSYIYLKGLNKNFDKAYSLLNQLFTSPVVEESRWKNLVGDILFNRQNQKTDKGAILQQAMRNFARYGGKKNPFTNIVSQKELESANAAFIEEKIKTLLTIKYKVWYYGPASIDGLKGQINNILAVENKLKNPPKGKTFKPVQPQKNLVYYVPYDMVQAEILWERPLPSFSVANIPTATVFNEYFGSGMYSLVFQTIRESKALAYSSYAAINVSNNNQKPTYAMAYIGTQADKMSTAINGMQQLMDSLPTDRFMGDRAKGAVRKQIETERITGQNLLPQSESAQKLDLKMALNQYVYDNLEGVSYENLIALQKQAYAQQNFHLCVIASRDKINLEELKMFGELKVLTLEEVFGY